MDLIILGQNLNQLEQNYGKLNLKEKKEVHRILYTIKNPFMIWLHSFKKKTQKNT